MISGGDAAYAAALVLAATFTWAAAAKVIDQRGTVRAFRSLGLPRASLAARAVPALEAALAAALVVRPGPAGAAALVVLAFFTAFIAGRLRQGVDASCGCFGSAGGHRLSGADLVRNTLLAGAAGLATLSEGPRIPTPATWAVTALAVATGWVVVRIARVRASTPPKGSP